MTKPKFWPPKISTKKNFDRKKIPTEKMFWSKKNSDRIFFSTEFLDDNIILSKEESTHCVIVLRHNIGDIIYIVDGEGNRFSCKIINIDGGIVKSEIIKKENLSNDSNHYIHIIILCKASIAHNRLTDARASLCGWAYWARA